MILISVLICLIFGMIFIRYLPIWHVKCIDSIKLNKGSIQIIDVRDYNESYKSPVPNALNIPIAYLRRSYNEIEAIEIYIVASNNLEKNISIRFLRKKGFKIVGYALTTCECKKAG